MKCGHTGVKLGPKWSIFMLKLGFLGLLIIINLFIYFMMCFFCSTYKELSFGAKFAFQKCCAPNF